VAAGAALPARRRYWADAKNVVPFAAQLEHFALVPGQVAVQDEGSLR
jgi:hypothetical protein